MWYNHISTMGEHSLVKVASDKSPNDRRSVGRLGKDGVISWTANKEASEDRIGANLLKNPQKLSL